MTSSAIETPRGPAGLQITDPDGPPVSMLVLGHGAGGGVGAPDLTAVHDAAVAAGVRVVLVTQPYRMSGRKVAAPTAQLDQAWTALIALPLVSGHTGLIETGKTTHVEGDEYKRHEGNKTDAQLERIRALGGVVAVILHQGKRSEIKEYQRPDGSTPVPFFCGNSSEAISGAFSLEAVMSN